MFVLRRLSGTAALVSMLTSAPAAALSVEFLTKITASDGGAGDQFGFSVALDGTTALVGAPSNGGVGAGYAFDTQTLAETKLTATAGMAGDEVGFSVSLADTTAVLGARFEGDDGFRSGAAFVFDLTLPGQLRLSPLDNRANDTFGFAVATDGTNVFVAAPQDDDNGAASGSYYRFDTAGQELDKVLASDGGASERFGIALDTDGTSVISGTRFDEILNPGVGAAYVFTTDGQEQAKLTPSDGAVGDLFGLAVAVEGLTALAGAPGDDDNGLESGAAYVFDTAGQQQRKLTPDDGAEGDQFGRSLALSGGTALIGAPLDDANGASSGAAYLFDPLSGAQLLKIVAPDGALEDRFGLSVA
ncbi:MAG: FG-GAP repeat protein, partial [Pseudomonadota bacterium]